MSSIRLLCTGPELIGEGIRGIEPVIEELISCASSEIHLMAYRVTPQSSRILDLLEDAAARGVRLRMVVNSLQSQHSQIRGRLKLLAERFPWIDLVDFQYQKGRQIHAKVIIVDRRRAVIGSANLSWGGMVANYEVGVLIEGEAAWKLAWLVDRLATLPSKGRMDPR